MDLQNISKAVQALCDYAHTALLVLKYPDSIVFNNDILSFCLETVIAYYALTEYLWTRAVHATKEQSLYALQ